MSRKLIGTFLIFASLYLAIVYFSFRFFKSNPDLKLAEPAVGTYRGDELIFLKTFYLVKNGQGYYQSFAQGVAGDTRGIVLTSDTFQWRLPAIFYLWKFTSIDGYFIFVNFWFLTLVSLICIYFILKKFIGSRLAFLGPILVVPYFLDVLFYKTSFLFTEWWAWFFLTFGLTFFLYQKKKVAFIFFLLSAVTRELMIFPLILFFIYSLFLKKDRRFFLAIVTLTLLFFAFHAFNVSLQESITPASGSSPLTRLHSFDKQSFLSMISFSMRKYPLVNFKIHYLIVLLAGVSLAVNLARKQTREVFYIFIAGFGFLLLLPFVTTSAYNDYWGVLFMSTLILTIPLAFAKK